MGKRTLISAFLLSFLILTGCNLPKTSDGNPPVGQPQTLAAQTVNAVLTLNSSGGNLLTMAPTNTLPILPTNTPPPSNTPGPSNTPYIPAATSTSKPCNLATFIDDVTIPDGTEMSPGESFTKTWKLKNIGSCTWNSNYKLVFDSGDSMGASAIVAFPSVSVAPNQQVNLSVTFTAPSSPGDYRSDWKLRSDTGEVFGLSTGGSFYTEITVIAPLSYTLTVVNSHICGSSLLLTFAVENTGTEYLKSSTGVLTNKDTSVSTTLSIMNSPFFEEPDECTCAYISDADPGETYYFMVDLGSATSGDKFQVTVTFCTEINLGGDCLDNTKNYTVP
jgi:hypothetical protein